MELSKLEKHYCINCGQEATQQHHVVPKALGGNDTTNIVWLCDKCHGLIHGIEFGNKQLSHSELTKLGIARAKENGQKMGRPKKQKQEIIDKLKQMKLNGISNKLAAERLGVSTATISRMLRKIKW